MKLASWNVLTCQVPRKNGGMAAGAQLGPPRTMLLLDSLLRLLVPSTLNNTNLIFKRKHCVSSVPILLQGEASYCGTPNPQVSHSEWWPLLHSWTPQHTQCRLPASGMCGHLEIDKGQCHSLKEIAGVPNCCSTSQAMQPCQGGGVTQSGPGEGSLWQWTWGCGQSEGQSDLSGNTSEHNAWDLDLLSGGRGGR